nr:hypothetical protein [Tanacetum cinerariifolium]
MSDSKDSAVTYTSVYTDSEPERVFWGTDEEPLPPVDSPTTKSPGYVVESDPEEDPEYEDDEEQDGPVDYPMGEGDDEGDDDGDSFGDDVADEDEDMEEEEEDEEEEDEEEHVASADSTAIIPVVELVSSPEGTKPSERPPRKRSCLFAIGSRYEAGESSTTRPTEGQGTDYGFVGTVDVEARRQGIRDVGYGIRDTWIDPAEAVPAIAPTTVEEVNTKVVELAELHEHDIQDFHALLEDAQDGDSMDFRGGGLCCSSGMEPLYRTESGDISGASNSP